MKDMNAILAAASSAATIDAATLDSAVTPNNINNIINTTQAAAETPGVLGYILGFLLILASIVMIVVIILQEGNQQGIGVVSGGADTFFSKNKARSIDAMLSRTTKWFAIGFVVIVLVLNIIAFFAK